MRRSALVFAPLLALVLLAGCDQGSGNNFRPADGSDSTSDGSKGSDFGGGGGGGGGRGDLESCVVGDWKADPEALAALGMDTSEFDALGADVNFDFVFTFSRGGDFDWNLKFSSAGVTSGTAFSMDVNMDMIGTWKISGSDQMDLTLDDASGKVSYTVGGVTQSEDMSGDDLGMSDAGDTTMTVTCSSSTLTMTDNASETMTLTRK